MFAPVYRSLTASMMLSANRCKKPKDPRRNKRCVWSQRLRPAVRNEEAGNARHIRRRATWARADFARSLRDAANTHQGRAADGLGGTPRRCVLLILAGILSRQRSKVVEAGHAGDRGIAAAEFRGQPRRQTSKILLRRVAFIDLLQVCIWCSAMTRQRPLSAKIGGLGQR